MSVSRELARLLVGVTLSLVCSLGIATPSPASGADRFVFADQGASIFYRFSVGDVETADSVVFFYGGSGCRSWKHSLPAYAEMMGLHAIYFALNKRYVVDEGADVDACGAEFHARDNPRQWFADEMEFISAKLRELPVTPRNVVLVGMSEGGMAAVRVARSRQDVTHLLVVGDGGWSMRDNLRALMGPEAVEEGWQQVTQEAGSLEKTWLGMPYRYWFDVMDYVPMQDYLALDFPVLIAIGEHDKSVPAASAMAVQQQALAAGKRNIGVVVYPDADHSLMADGHSYLADFLRQAGNDIEEGVAN